MTPLIVHYLILSRPLGYFLIFLGLAIEGDIVLLVIAYLTHQGFFDFGDMIVVSLLGIFTGDIFWLILGRKLSRLSPFAHRMVSKLSSPLDQHLRERPAHAIFVSKFTYGLHRAILVRLGQNGLSLREFLKADIPASLIWFAVVGGLGYLGSGAVALAKNYLHYTELGLLLVVIVFLLISHLSRRFSEEKI